MKSTLQSHHQKSRKGVVAALVVIAALASSSSSSSSSCSEAFVPMAVRSVRGFTTQSQLSPSFSSQPYSPVTFQLLRLQASTIGDTNGAISNTDTGADLLLLEKFDQALQNGKLREAEQIMTSRNNSAKSLPMPMTDARWDLIFNAIEERTRRAEMDFYPEETKMENLRHTQNLQQLAEFPDVSASRSEMTDMYRALAAQEHLTLFGAVTVKEPIVSSISSRSLVPPELLEQTIQLPMQALTPQASNSILLAGVTLAVVEGLVSMVVPGVLTLNFLVLMTLLLATLDRLFLNGAVLENYVKLFSPGMQQRIARHEAGHFLAAYLLGCPVEGVVLSAWEALQDDRFGKNRQVSAGTSFFDPQLSQQMNSGLGMPSQQRQQQQSAGVTRSSIDRYSIIVMAGIAAEADYYGRADGGAGDEMALIAFLSQLNRQPTGGGPFLSSLMASSSAAAMPNNQSWSPELIKNQARWGALQAVALLREYKPAYEALVAVLEKPGPTRLCDCIRAIETAAKEHNLKPTAAAVAIRELERQQQQRSSGTTNNGAGAAAATAKAAVTSVSSPEEMATTLQEYRSAVEKRLHEVEARLGEIQQEK
jgi:hypothetical protein